MKGIGQSGKCWVGIVLSMAVVIGVASCKKEDRDPPAVALSLPMDGFTIMADSEFVVAGVASDDVGLSSITATLYETETEVVVQSKTINISGLSNNFSFRLAAGDRYTPSGQYSLKVTAFDGAQNQGLALTQVVVQELPLQYRGVVWAGDNGSNTFSIQAQDTAGALMMGPSGLQNLAGLLADNRNNQLVAVQSTPGWIRAWSLDGFDPLFQLDLPQGSGSETFTGVSMNEGKYFGTLKVPPYLRSYRFDGAPLNDFEQAVHPATAVLATNDRIYAGLQGVVGTPTKIDAYDAAGANLLSTQLLDWPVEKILPLDDEQLLVCGNLSGQGRIIVLERASMSIVQEVTLPATFVSAVSAHGRAWVLTDQDLYEFFPSNGTLSASLVSGSYSALGVDATLDRVFLGGMDRVEVHSGAGNLLTTISGAFGIVKFIETRYNK